MSSLPAPARARFVRDLFGDIASHYDLMNRLMTAGQDMHWRREAIRWARLRPGDLLLDLGAGTGDLAEEAHRQQPRACITAADFALQMVRTRRSRAPVSWCAADALLPPFQERTFDAVVSGFLIRNLVDPEAALREQYRILKPGGRIVILDTTRPRRSLFAPFIRLHMRLVVPALGGLLAGSRPAYTYLSESTESFLSAEELAACMRAAGFTEVTFRLLTFGAVALHRGQRPG